MHFQVLDLSSNERLLLYFTEPPDLKCRFSVFPCTLLSDTHIVIVRPESRLQLFGSFEMQALFGDVSVNGFLCKAAPANDERWLSVVAPWASAPPVCIKCPLGSSSKAPKRSHLQHRLKLVRFDQQLLCIATDDVLLRTFCCTFCVCNVFK